MDEKLINIVNQLDLTNEKVEPFWNSEQANLPKFLTRTTTAFSRVPLKEFVDRGFENQFLNSILEYLPEGAYVAGGFLTNLLLEKEMKSSDIDFFFTSEKAFKDTFDLFANALDDTTAWAYKDYELASDPTLVKSEICRFAEFKHKKASRPKVQLIKLYWYDSPEAVIDSFDLTVAQFITNGKDLIFNPLGLTDLLRKRIVLHRMQFPASTMRRIIKYTQKGFYACPGALQKIAEATQEALNDGSDNPQIFYLD